MNSTGWISLSRFLAVLGIVMLHSAAFFYNNFESETLGWSVGNIGNSVTRWAVPVFVMLSGALILGASREYTAAEFYKRRLSRILIPLLFWSVFYSVVWYAQNRGSASINDVINNFIYGRPYYHMWFMFMITGLYAVTPLIRPAIKKLDKSASVKITVILFILSSSEIILRYYAGYEEPVWIFWFIPFIAYFASGHLIIKYELKDISITLCAMIATISCVFIHAMSEYYAHSGEKTQLFYEPLFPVVIIMSLSVYILLMKWSKPFNETLGRLSFGVYLIHPFFLGVYFKAAKAFTFSHPIESFIISWSLCSVLSFIIAYLLKRMPYLNHTV